MTSMLDKAKVNASVKEAEHTPAPVEEDDAPLSVEVLVDRSLKELDMTRKDALTIVEDIFTKGVYTESVQLRKDMFVTFRTRTTKEDHALKKELISAGEMSVFERNYLIQLHNLSCSLVSLGDTALSEERTEEAIRERKNFILELPSVLLDVLIRNLAKFDMRVMVATQDPLLKDF